MFHCVSPQVCKLKQKPKPKPKPKPKRKTKTKPKIKFKKIKQNPCKKTTTKIDQKKILKKEKPKLKIYDHYIIKKTQNPIKNLLCILLYI